MKTEQQKTICKMAMKAFEKATGLLIDHQKDILGNAKHPDKVLAIRNGRLTRKYPIEVKANVTRATIALVEEGMAKLGEKYLLVADYVTPQLADLLQKNGIFFIDAAGNAYINDPPLHVIIKGNKRPEGLRATPVKRVFKAGGLRVIFAMLCQPDLIEKPLREIAGTAGVALGTVAGVVNELKELGYIIDMGQRGRKLVNRERLLNRWVVAYPEQLKPKLRIGYFKHTQHDWWKEADLNADGYWGGEIAGAILTDHLKPKNITIYAKEPVAKIILKNKLEKHPDGTIEIVNAFWEFEIGGNTRNLVHPILVYADLMETGDPRNVETAKIVYEKEIARLVRES